MLFIVLGFYNIYYFCNMFWIVNLNPFVYGIVAIKFNNY